MFSCDLKNLRFLICAFLGIFFVFTTCKVPMGLGDSIDWEAPVLTIDPVPTPIYVRLGTTLQGSVTDNVGVQSVIMIDAVSGQELFQAEVTGDRWRIDLNFSEEQNGEKITAQILSYDRARNSSEQSMITVTLNIDIRPPVTEDMWIIRTSMKTTLLESYTDLKALETTDPRGEKSANVDKYQNGWFHINGKVSEEETGIELVSLNIYDARDPNKLLLSLPKLDDSSVFSPRWLIKEEDIINAGEAVFLNYRTNYYDNNERYYYRVAITAIDKSENENEDLFTEDEGFFCMWRNGDEPKGIFDPVMGTVVARGTPFPVEFFDDDQLKWAYSALFTKEQWDGDKPVADSIYFDGGSSEEKLAWLKNELIDKQTTIYNWRFDKHNDTSESLLKELIGSASVSDKLVYIPTGNQESDYGDYVLFTLTGDKKLEPHTGTGPEITNTDTWKGRSWNIQVIDDSAPIIVFDTVITTDPDYTGEGHLGGGVSEHIPEARTGDSPEENTFPKLTDGRYFEINGYTLRENSSGANSVRKLRMAWIPFEISGDSAAVKAVEKALGSNDYPSSFAGLSDIQHWEFNEDTGGDAQLIEGTPEKIGGDGIVSGSEFKKQVFRKKFDVLGGADDIKNEYKNFYYKDKFENETKLFVFCAIDNMGHTVYRQLRLLGMKTPPTLAVYDISNKDVTLPAAHSIPNIYENNNYDGKFTQVYADELKMYNQRTDVYNALKAVSMSGNTLILTDNDKTIPFQTYTLGTVLKYWVMAEESGDLAIKDIIMQDVTLSGNPYSMGSDFNAIGQTERAISFIEEFPDVTSRVFLFTATDTLGNTAEIQRTVAITNAAVLRDITTTTQNGSYGIDNIITLEANFTGIVRIANAKPELNVRYKIKVGSNEEYRIKSIPCNENPGDEVLSLTFDFKVEEGYTGCLETMYDNPDMTKAGGVDITYVGADPEHKERPIRLLHGAGIIDVSRNEPAFVPGYNIGSLVSAPWKTANGSLQSRKSAIQLDGQRPKITGLTVSGKTAFSSSPTMDYYFKTGEIINFTFTADKSIRADGTPKLIYSISSLNGDTKLYESDAGNTKFTYQRPDGSHGMVFSLIIDEIPDSVKYGKLTGISLAAGGIADEVGNKIVDTTINMSYVSSTNIYIKKSAPAAPETSLNNTIIGTAPNNSIDYNQLPTLSIAVPDEPWAVTTQYSLNGGSTWVNFPDAYSSWTTETDAAEGTLKILNGEWNLKTRYIDRAGNQGSECEQAVYVNMNFPKLESVSVEQPAGTYILGQKLDFSLNFAENVRVENKELVTITLKHRSDTGGAANEEIRNTLTPVSVDTKSINFSWTIPNGKDMTAAGKGLYIAAIDLTGLIDRFGNSGKKSESSDFSANNITIDGYDVNNIPEGILVDSITPQVNNKVPDMGGVSTDNKTIELTFSENVVKGSGTITIRPRAGYAIPPVFEDAGYWLDYNGDLIHQEDHNSSPVNGTTYIPSFREIFDKVNDSQKFALAGGTTFSSLAADATNERTGQSAGPYKKMTHGLIAGKGYSGNEEQNISVGNDYMVPDTATKWVLDYQYSILENSNMENNTIISGIREALTAAKFRWQEIDASSVTITGNLVRITLNEPLIKGLDWEVDYPAGTFTDEAGNNAAAEGYWFQSGGVQAPVIRVNRRSYDARNSNWASRTNRNYEPPPNTSGWDTNTIAVTDDRGWGINDFNSVHYRVESETQGATVTASVLIGTNTDNSSVTAAWTGNVQTAVLNAGSSLIRNRPWNNTTAATGEWILSNLVRRAGAGSYTVRTKNGTETRTFQGTYNGFRSYNKDFESTDESSAESAALSQGQGVITFDALEASKNYVIGSASRNSAAEKGYEGVFRTVIALNRQNNETNFVLVEGSNIKNGMPSIAGFPVRDAEETGDNRYVKAFFRDNGDYYWVSTEIVCEWYFLSWGQGGGTHMSGGEVNNYLTVGYGDLTYGYNISSY